MFFVSELYSSPPVIFKTPLQEQTYRALDELRIPYNRVETDEAITMADCVQINQRLEMKMVKTLFLCTRNEERFFLFITAGDKPFQTKRFGNSLGVPRVSFAPVESMENILGTKIGAATVFSVLLDTENRVKVVIDREVAEDEWYGCSDGTTTGYMKVATASIIGAILPYAEHLPDIIDI